MKDMFQILETQRWNSLWSS